MLEIGKFSRKISVVSDRFARLAVRTAASLDVAASEVVDDVGPIRFFSIDGGHWATIMVHDLAMAQESVADYGVVALDDFCRPQ